MAILLDMNRTHIPVLAGELIDLTAPAAGEIAVDCTFGAGGHARLVADRLGPTGTLVCIDRDPAAEDRFVEMSREAPCETRFLGMNYADGLSLLLEEGVSADLVYLDLGVSSMQVDARERGFSYSYDAPLDMRMDQGQELDARAVVNAWEERRLSQLFHRYGEDPSARRIAREIVRRRARSPIETTGELVAAVEAAVPAAVRRNFGGGHPAKRVFQAIRIAVNDELDSLDAALPAGLGPPAPRRPPGRDLLPFARGPAREALPGRSRPRVHLPARLPHLRLWARARGASCSPAAPWRPTPGEVADNPRSKSGRLRVARKIDSGEDD